MSSNSLFFFFCSPIKSSNLASELIYKVHVDFTWTVCLSIDAIDQRTRDWKWSNKLSVYMNTPHYAGPLVTVPRLAVAVIQALVASFSNCVSLYKPYHAIYDYVYFTKM